MLPSLIRAPKTDPGSRGFVRHVSAEDSTEVGMTLGTWKIGDGERVDITSADAETAVLAFSGDGSLSADGRKLEFSRTSWMETPPTVVHCSAGNGITASCRAGSAVEVIVVQTPNSRSFAPRFYAPSDIQAEHRGKGLLQDTCYRIVRLAFDDTNGPPESNLVLGEVINFAGRWSSYPPHSHPQPEIYYYRFEPSNGYGHGELGDEVFRIRNGDLLAITGNRSHCQVSAPGYNMYYLWAVRHLEGNRYKGFTFDPEHAWTLKQRSTP